MYEKTKWIRAGECGEVNETSFSELLLKLSYDNYGYVSFYTNRLTAGIIEKGVPDPLINDLQYLLEIRVYNETEEFHAVRTAMGKQFKWRIASEGDMDDSVYFVTETQLLDIDQKKGVTQDGANSIFHATGGGKYPLPVPQNTDSIELIDYFRYDKFGNLQFADFRIKRFYCGNDVKEKEKGYVK